MERGKRTTAKEKREIICGSEVGEKPKVKTTDIRPSHEHEHMIIE